MCGLIAAFTRQPFQESAARAALDRMNRRGPDGEGEWREDGAYMGHRRLAILDLDPRAAQPMQSVCGRFVIAFNGEIYNYQSLRHQLEARGVLFRTTSDTEVILALFADQGEAMLPNLHGMFAFVIWDRLSKQAFAARDPYGIKPLYVATIDGGIILASQVKALASTGLVSLEPDPRGQASFWMLGSVPEPHTWFRNMRALPAGHCLWIEKERLVRQRCWHDIGNAWRTAKTDTSLPIPHSELQLRVKDALHESVKRHLVADVPIGVFLSGGIDSGALAGLMTEAGAAELQGVTIAYDEYAGKHEDEAPLAAQIAQHYGIRHHIRRVTKDEFLTDLPDILDAMDQPSVDGVNTWYAAKAVAELGLKVVVSGVGGDELFMGYDTFRRLPKLVRKWQRWSHCPGMLPFARMLAELQMRRSGKGRWRHAPDWALTIGGAWWLRRSIFSPDELPAFMDERLVQNAVADFNAEKWVSDMTGPLPKNEVLALAQIESMTYLRNQLLRDSDWASMYHSVELRTPLVDAHLLDELQPLLGQFASFPDKTLLALAPSKALPRAIIERRKTGFPVNRWLQEARQGSRESNPLRNWMETLAKQSEPAEYPVKFSFQGTNDGP